MESANLNTTPLVEHKFILFERLYSHAPCAGGPLRVDPRVLLLTTGRLAQHIDDGGYDDDSHVACDLDRDFEYVNHLRWMVVCGLTLYVPAVNQSPKP